jgi:hypothetical protein
VVGLVLREPLEHEACQHFCLEKLVGKTKNDWMSVGDIVVGISNSALLSIEMSQ